MDLERPQMNFSGLGRLSMSISKLVRSFWSKRELLGWSGARVMKVFIFVSFFELLRLLEAVCEHLLACAVILIQTRASGMLWSSSYDGFYIFHQKQILFELLRLWEAICEHLHACAVVLIQTRASGMVWSSSYEGFHFCFNY